MSSQRLEPSRKGPAPGPAGASCLDTEGATSQVATEEGHNSTRSEKDPWPLGQKAKRLTKSDLSERLARGRPEFLANMAVLTEIYRRRRADAYLTRGAQRALEQAREWRAGTWLDDDDRESLRHMLASLARRDARFPKLKPATGPLFRVARGPTGKAQALPEKMTQWHGSRAKGLLEHFERVDDCANDRRVLTLVCRGCSYTPKDVIPIGCSSQFFCGKCCKRIGLRLQRDFERKRFGVRSIAARAGLTERRNRFKLKGGRLGERLVTFTLPHWGGPVERIEALQATWPRFLRLFSDELRPELEQVDTGIFTVEDARFNSTTGELRVLRTKDEGKAKGSARRELSLWDLVQHFRVFEWTPGKDAKGNPHFHWWLFSQYVDQVWLQKLWTRAFCEVLGHRYIDGDPDAPDRADRYAKVGRLLEDGTHAEPSSGPSVDVRTAEQLQREGKSVKNELIKYLTKEWEIGAAGDVSRVSPEVFAKVYEALHGTRKRQSSAGLAQWAADEHLACPECGHENERGHWAHISIERNRLDRRWQGRAPLDEPPRPVAIGPPRSIADREAQHRAAYDLAREQGWPEAQLWFVECLGAELRAAREWQQEAAREAERDADWLTSPELRAVQARWKGGRPSGESAAEPAPLAYFRKLRARRRSF